MVNKLQTRMDFSKVMIRRLQGCKGTKQKKMLWNADKIVGFKNSAFMKLNWLTGAVVVRVVILRSAPADAQESFVVIVLIPIEGGDSGESPLGVTTYEAGGSSHYIPKGQIFLEERGHDVDELLGATPVEQLWGDKTTEQVRTRAFKSASSFLTKRKIPNWFLMFLVGVLFQLFSPISPKSSFLHHRAS